MGTAGAGTDPLGPRWRHRAARVTVLAVLAGMASAAFADPVRTEGGLSEGVQEKGVRVFKGIPFAAPPVGDLRWRDPQPPAAWPGVKKADTFSPVCMQEGAYPPESPPEPSSEDCLYLNVWTPLVPNSDKLPVMVWIYGGGLENGSASTPLYAGDELASKNVIVVTANYRLGAFGFLAHPDLTNESTQRRSGNYGLLDQLAALGWVHRNIAAFGGDPDRVTVFGQSSGSISISALVASPSAKGLFQRAIGESGGLFEPMELDPGFKLAGAEQQGQEFMAECGATTIQALRSKPAAEILKTGFSTHPILDGFVLPETPYDAYRDGRQNNVALLIGSNADEGQLFLAHRQITIESFAHELGHDFPSFLVSILGPKPGASDSEARASAAVFERDLRFRWDMWAWARLAGDAGKNKVFFYQFSRAPPFHSGDRYFGWGATHGMEMPYVFNHLDQQPLPWTAQDRLLASTMSTYWTNFARSGDPNGPGLPTWPEFNPSSPLLMYLGDAIELGPMGDEAALRRIDRLYAVARFVLRNVRAIAILAGATVLAMLALIVRRVRGARARRQRIPPVRAPAT